MKTEVTPKATEVYVDGYYAGVADQFDGAFTRLHTSPGGHAVTLRLDGYRTVTQNIYVRPDSTFKLKEAMEKLAPGRDERTGALADPPRRGQDCVGRRFCATAVRTASTLTTGETSLAGRQAAVRALSVADRSRRLRSDAA